MKTGAPTRIATYAEVIKFTGPSVVTFCADMLILMFVRSIAVLSTHGGVPIMAIPAGTIPLESACDGTQKLVQQFAEDIAKPGAFIKDLTTGDVYQWTYSGFQQVIW